MAETSPNLQTLPEGSYRMSLTANGIEPVITTKAFTYLYDCSYSTALDRFNQVEYFFTCLNQSERVIRSARKREMPVSSVMEFLQASGGEWFTFNKWREDIMRLARSVKKSEMR